MILNPPKVYQECIVIQADAVDSFTWIGMTSEGAPSEVRPRILLNGNYALPATVSTMQGVPDDLRNLLLISRGTMNTGGEKSYSDTQILSCCDFYDHTDFHEEVEE